MHCNTFQLCSIRQKLTKDVPRDTKSFQKLQSTYDISFVSFMLKNTSGILLYRQMTVWKIFIKTVLMLKSNELI